MTKKVNWLIGVCSIAVAPWWNYDPINPIKLIFLCVAGFTALVNVLLQQEKVRRQRNIAIIVLIFFIQVMLSLFFSGINLTLGLYGTYGRLFGAVTWCMLLAIFMFYSISSNAGELNKVFMGFASFSAIYSFLQMLGWDFAPWNNDYDPILGFLGNPNFQSSFLGLFCIGLLGFAIENIRNRKRLLVAALALLLNIIIIYRTNSIQGMFVFVVGILTYVLYNMIYRKQKVIFLLSVANLAILFVLFSLGVVGKGPISDLVHRGTLAIRGDYWLAALNMTSSNVITGVGPDGYGEMYRLFRPIESLTRVNSEVTSDSAHNGFLELSSNLGLLALILYLLLSFFVLKNLIIFILESRKLDKLHMTMTAIWLGFNSQMLISPNQIGLTVWGWAFGGALIGYSSLDRSTEKANFSNSSEHKMKSKLTEGRNDFSSTIASITGLVVGLTISLPPYIANAQFRSALVSSDATKIIRASHTWPQSSTTILYTSRLLFANNLMSQGYQTAKYGVSLYPKSFELHRIMLQYKSLTEAEQRAISDVLRKLDPLNKDL